MVKRDRNHPSVTIWSFCNEGACGASDGSGFRNVTYQYDGTRPVLGNDDGNLNLNKCASRHATLCLLTLLRHALHRALLCFRRDVVWVYSRVLMSNLAPFAQNPLLFPRNNAFGWTENRQKNNRHWCSTKGHVCLKPGNAPPRYTSLVAAPRSPLPQVTTHQHSQLPTHHNHFQLTSTHRSPAL